jgi:four helix bundle protein
MVKTFKDLKIWSTSIEPASEVYRYTGQLPPSEKFGICSQMNRAAVSIPSSIAEGFGRNGKKEFRRFLRISMGSLFELQTQIILSHKLFNTELEWYNQLYERTRELERMLSSFIRTLE